MTVLHSVGLMIVYLEGLKEEEEFRDGEGQRSEIAKKKQCGSGFPSRLML